MSTPHNFLPFLHFASLKIDRFTYLLSSLIRYHAYYRFGVGVGKPMIWELIVSFICKYQSQVVKLCIMQMLEEIVKVQRRVIFNLGIKFCSRSVNVNWNCVVLYDHTCWKIMIATFFIYVYISLKYPRDYYSGFNM